jgi:hypothetical protein
MGTLPPLCRPGLGRCDDLDVPRQQVVDCPRPGGAREAELVAQPLERHRLLRRPQVEVAAEEQRRFPRPLHRCRGGPEHIGRGPVGPVVCRVQVGDAELAAIAGCDARKCHRSPLRQSAMNLQLPTLEDPTAPVRLSSVRWG